jgi:hypothetical protein
MDRRKASFYGRLVSSSEIGRRQASEGEGPKGHDAGTTILLYF